MGKRQRRRQRRRQRADLPLFDLPLNPGDSGADSALDLELAKGGDSAGDLELSPGRVEDQREVTPLSEAAVSDASLDPALGTASPTEADPPLAVTETRQGNLSSLFARNDPTAVEDASEALVGGSASEEEASVRANSEKRELEVRAHLGDRILGGMADLAVQGLVLGLAIAATHGLGVAVSLNDWQPFALLMLAFSFLYWMIPLAFWGQTPGMAWVGHTARSENYQPLTFGQTFWRWLGALLTLGLGGLPILGAWKGRSLSDHLSRSHTWSSDAVKSAESEQQADQ